MKIKRLLIAAGATAALPLLAATTVSASPGTVKAVTHAQDHPDTCSCTTNTPSPGGNVWAYDNLSRQFSVTDNGGGNYTVVVTDTGSFKAFAEPNNADLSTVFPITATGSIKGTYTLAVTASQGPSPQALPSQEPGDVTTTAMIQQLFQNSASNIAGGDYSYTYRSGRDTYVQTTSSITGDITGRQ